MRAPLWLSLFVIVAACSPKQESGSAIRPEVLSYVDSIMNARFPPDEPGAAIRITKGGMVIYRKAFGLASLELNVPMSPEMIFRIGSITKQFTAVAILLLEEQGKLSVKDDIHKYLPTYPTHGATITIEHLLTHTSGIPDFVRFPEDERLNLLPHDTNSMLAVFKDHPLDFQPGEKCEYSNSGYILLGALIEHVSGMSYEDFIQRNILEKLHMNNTFCENAGKVVRNRIEGYTKDSTGFKRELPSDQSGKLAAAGLRSNVDDLALWNKSLLDGALISKEALAKGFRPFKLQSGEISEYGYGWDLRRFMSHRAYSHAGSLYGFLAESMYFPEVDLYVTLLTNNDTAPLSYITYDICSHLLGENPKEVPVLSRTESSEYAGTYQTRARRWDIFQDGDSLLLVDQLLRVKMLPVKKDEFYLVDRIAAIVFNRDSSGHVASFTFKDRFWGTVWNTASRVPE